MDRLDDVSDVFLPLSSGVEEARGASRLASSWESTAPARRQGRREGGEKEDTTYYLDED